MIENDRPENERLKSTASNLLVVRDGGGDWKELADKFGKYSSFRIRADADGKKGLEGGQGCGRIW